MAYGYQQKRTKLGFIYGIIVIVIASVSLLLIYQQHKSDLKVHHSTFQIPKLPSFSAQQDLSLTNISGKPFPLMNSAYQLIFQSPSGSSLPSERDYISSSGVNEIVNDAQNICSSYNMTIKKSTTGYDIINPTSSYLVTTLQCYNANNSWSFNVEQAIALASPEYNGQGTLQSTNLINGQVPKNILSKNLNTFEWVDVRSLGSPTVNCNDSHVCYIQKSKLVTGGS